MEARYFIISYTIIKSKHDFIYNQKVTVPNPTGEIGIDAKHALNIFASVMGGLKRNEIISIQEIDKNGKNIGEPIVPLKGSTIVPTGR